MVKTIKYLAMIFGLSLFIGSASYSLPVSETTEDGKPLARTSDPKAREVYPDPYAVRYLPKAALLKNSQWYYCRAKATKIAFVIAAIIGLILGKKIYRKCLVNAAIRRFDRLEISQEIRNACRCPVGGCMNDNLENAPAVALGFQCQGATTPNALAGHALCEACYLEVLRTNPVCPICRTAPISFL